MRYHIDRINAVQVMVIAIALLAFCGPPASAQQIWEYSPYRVRLWLRVDPSLPISEANRQEIPRHVRDVAERLFRAACDFQIDTIPDSLSEIVNRDLGQLAVADLLATDFVLVMPRQSEELDGVRTLDSALEKLDKIEIAANRLPIFQTGLASYTAETPYKTLKEKLASFDGSEAEFLEKIAAGNFQAAFVRQTDLPGLGESVRLVTARLPWTVENLLREMDKIIILDLAWRDQMWKVTARELDCPTRQWGPIASHETVSWSFMPRLINYSLQQAFVPLARVEEAESATTTMILRAGGLIQSDENPAQLRVGEVMQPIIRRDDRNGLPSILEAIPFTLVAITANDGINLNGQVFSGVRGSLQGRKNKRTQRYCLKIRPIYESSELSLVTKAAPDVILAGSEIYGHTPTAEGLKLLGRTDWRGKITITKPSEPSIIKVLQPRAKPAAVPPASPVPSPTPAADQASLVAVRDAKAVDPAATSEGPEGTADSPAATELVPEVPPPPKTLELLVPIVELVVKNGDTLLAKLPIVPGHQAKVVAELVNDERRLEAESYLRGFQGEILDLVARRKILAERIRLRIKENNLKEAEKLLLELQNAKNYEALAQSLETIQKQVLDPNRGKILPGVQRRIDSMFQSTRNMLQKFLQDNLVREMELAIAGATG